MAADLLASTKNALTQLEAVFGSSPTPKPATQPSTPEPLRFGTVFAPAFEHMGCSEQAINDLRHIYDHNVGALRRTFQEAFFTSVRKLAELGAWSLPETEAALRHRYTEDYAHSHRHLAAELTAVVQAARAHADRLTASEAEQPGSFTPDVIKILTSAFDRCHTITRAERRELAQATSLDERQIATWVRAFPLSENSRGADPVARALSSRINDKGGLERRVRATKAPLPRCDSVQQRLTTVQDDRHRKFAIFQALRLRARHLSRRTDRPRRRVSSAGSHRRRLPASNTIRPPRHRENGRLDLSSLIWSLRSIRPPLDPSRTASTTFLNLSIDSQRTLYHRTTRRPRLSPPSLRSRSLQHQFRPSQ